MGILGKRSRYDLLPSVLSLPELSSAVFTLKTSCSTFSLSKVGEEVTLKGGTRTEVVTIEENEERPLRRLNR